MTTKAKPTPASDTPAWLQNPADPIKQSPEKAQMSPFSEPEPVDNPFLAPPPAEAPEAPKLHEPDEDTPQWGTFVNFILRYGDVIISGEYPTPRGECVDTIWRGVPVVDGPRARVRHKHAGWVNWETAVKGTKFE